MKGDPDDGVAASIVADIKKEKLVPAKRLAPLQRKLASEGLDESEWILLADLSTNEEA